MSNTRQAEASNPWRAPIMFLILAALFVLEGSFRSAMFSGSWNTALSILNMGLISAIMALGINMQWGYAGLFNAGVVGFLALGGLALSTGLLEGGIQAVGNGYLLGLLMCLGGSLSYAGVTLIAKTERRVTPFALAWWQCAVGVVVLAWVPFVYGWPAQPTAWAWLAGLGVFHTRLAYAILFTGMARLATGQIAVLQYVYPLTAIVVDRLVYGRTLSSVQVAGVVLMALALWTLRRPTR